MNVPPDLRKFVISRTLTKNSLFFSLIASLSFASVLSISFWPYAHHQHIAMWSITFLLVSIINVYYKNKKWLNQVLISDAILSVMWLFAVIIFIPEHSQGQQIFTILVFISVALSVAIFQHAFYPGAIISIGFTVPFASLLLVKQESIIEDNTHLFLAFIFISAWLGTLGLAWFLHKVFINRCNLQYDKFALISNVKNKVHQLEKLRKAEKLSRKEAENANAAKSRFLAHASHDLRQPLHAMGLLMDTIPDQHLSSQTYHVLGKMRQSLDVLSGLFDSLLDVTMLDTGQIDVNICSFPITRILQQVTLDFEELANKFNVQLSYYPSSIIVRSDPVILRRMVQNLVSNGITHAKGKKVLVGIRRQGEDINIAVYDSGKGINIKDQNKIFEEFTRINNGHSKSDLPGLGLGLAIVKRLAAIINVDIQIKSTPGKGSVFSINGLKVSNKEMHSQKPLTTSNGTHSPHLKVVIIDDDTEILQATDKLINKWGFICETYTKYKKGEFKMPDIIICDYELHQDLNGIEVILKLREKSASELPAILITATRSNEIKQLTNKNNIYLLIKPVKPAQLRSVLLTAQSNLM